MKKILSVFLCIAVLFGLASCGKGKNETENTTDSKINTTKNSAVSQNNPSENTSNSTEGNTSDESTSKNQVEKVKVTIPEGYTLL